MEQHPVSLIISDQRMPQMTGVEFLEKSVDRHPEVIRIILTGFTDIEDLIGAINTGRVYRYITKPWEPNDLRVTIRRALESLEFKPGKSQAFLMMSSDWRSWLRWDRSLPALLMRSGTSYQSSWGGTDTAGEVPG
ncbi:MAG: response regulator [bacterium]